MDVQSAKFITEEEYNNDNKGTAWSAVALGSDKALMVKLPNETHYFSTSYIDRHHYQGSPLALACQCMKDVEALYGH